MPLFRQGKEFRGQDLQVLLEDSGSLSRLQRAAIYMYSETFSSAVVKCARPTTTMRIPVPAAASQPAWVQLLAAHWFRLPFAAYFRFSWRVLSRIGSQDALLLVNDCCSSQTFRQAATYAHVSVTV